METTVSAGIMVGILALVTAIANALVSYFVNYKPNKRLEKLDIAINKFQDSNNLAHKNIITILNEHSVTIETYIKHQDINQKLSDIAKHAIEYTSCPALTISIDNLIKLLVDFIQNLLEIGLDNLSEEQLKIKLTSLQMNIISCFNPYFDKLPERQKTKLQYLYHNYALAIMDIKEDEVNDKTRRLFIKTEDFTHTFLKEGLKYFKEVIDEEVFE